jgi:hypothetical protein
MSHQCNCPHGGQPILLMRTMPEPRSPDLALAPTPPATKPEPEVKVVSCNRCGEANLAWQKSRTKGTFYLCRTTTVDGKVLPLPREFHACPAFRSKEGA